MIDYGVDIPNEIICLDNTMFVEIIEYGERKTKSGILIPTETMDYQGNFVRPRWAKVIWKADNIKNINIGDYVALEHGNWSLSMLINVNGEPRKVWFINKNSFKNIIAKTNKMPSHLAEYK